MILKHFEIYLKVLWVCLGEVENTHLMKLNQFIAPMDAQPYAKKASSYPKSLAYYLKALEH